MQQVEIKVSDDERYIKKLNINNVWIHTNTDYLGEVSETGIVANAQELRRYHPPAQVAFPLFIFK